MPPRQDTWFSVARQDEALVVQHKPRLQKVLSDFGGNPSLLLAIGKPRRRAILGTAFSHLTRNAESNAIHLRREHARSAENMTVLIADGPFRISNPQEVCGSGDEVSWLPNDSDSILGALYSRVLSPFTDVVCVFLSDVSSATELVDFISRWMQNIIQPQRINLPRLAIIIDGNAPWTDGAARWQREFARSVRQRTARPLESAFSSISTFTTRDPQSSKAKQEMLRQFLVAELNIARESRLRSRLHLRADHLCAFIEQAYRFFLKNIPFNYIEASRVARPVPPCASHQISLFVRDFLDHRSLVDYVLPVVASALMLDAFPPEMPGFDPLDVFETIYRPVWSQVEKALHLAASTVISLEAIIDRKYRLAKLSTSKEAHHQTMMSFERQWKSYRNYATCLMCLLRPPEFELPCGHTFCEVDIRRFGRVYAGNEFIVKRCFLCSRETNELTYKQKPRTRALRILGIDGGGIRGIIPLQLLQLLERQLRPYLSEYPIQNHFDMTVGTSSGGIIALAMVLQGTSISECLLLFQELTKRTFLTRWSRFKFRDDSRWNFTILPYILLRLLALFELIFSLFAGSLYPEKNINSALKRQFGESRTMTQYSAAAARGAKTAVTATGIPNGEYVIANYRVANSRQPQYRHAIPKVSSIAIKIWEAARATAAAPWYFSPHHIVGVRDLQDGGLWRNNPLDVALAEAGELWPDSAPPDIALSLGTGYEDREEESPGTPLLGTPQDPIPVQRYKKPQKNGYHFLGRLWACFLSSLAMDGEKFHKFNQARSIISDAQRFVRLNTRFHGELPALDDISSMDELRRETFRQYDKHRTLQVVGDILIASLFYFELRARPVRNRRGIGCIGQVKCDIEPGPILKRFTQELARHNSFFVVAGKSYPIDVKRVDHNHFDFELQVNISVEHIDCAFAICLNREDQVFDRSCAISASPFTLRNLLKQQQWDNPFGRDDHGPVSPQHASSLKRKASDARLFPRTGVKQVRPR